MTVTWSPGPGPPASCRTPPDLRPTRICSSARTNGIVWGLDAGNNGPHGSVSGPAILFAYDATHLNKLCSSPAGGAEAAGNAVKFTVPTVANGKVYVGTQTELSVFGLLPN